MYERNTHALDEVLGLTWAGQQRAVHPARRQLPDLFPTGFSDQQMAALIGVLNINSHELENVGGSGQFLSVCRDALFIDYGNFFYRPTLGRQETLFDSHGFVCTLCLCMGSGVMLPCLVQVVAASSSIGPNQLQFEWCCQTGGKVADAAEHARILVAEYELLGGRVWRSHRTSLVFHSRGFVLRL
ncbi:hypothetical protein PRIC1_012224 [Phytophthora ramorum]